MAAGPALEAALDDAEQAENLEIDVGASG